MKIYRKFAIVFLVILFLSASFAYASKLAFLPLQQGEASIVGTSAVYATTPTEHTYAVNGFCYNYNPSRYLTCSGGCKYTINANGYKPTYTTLDGAIQSITFDRYEVVQTGTSGSEDKPVYHGSYRPHIIYVSNYTEGETLRIGPSLYNDYQRGINCYGYIVADVDKDNDGEIECYPPTNYGGCDCDDNNAQKGDAEICFDGIDNDCDGYIDSADQDVSCACTESETGFVYQDGSLCVKNPFPTVDYLKVDTTPNPFEILDIKNSTINVISNSQEWFICDATGTLNLPGITEIKKYETFNMPTSGGILGGATGSEYYDYDGDGCNDANEILFGTLPNVTGDTPGDNCEPKKLFPWEQTTTSSGGNVYFKSFSECLIPSDCLTNISLSKDDYDDDEVLNCGDDKICNNYDDDNCPFLYNPDQNPDDCEYVPTNVEITAEDKNNSFLCYNDGQNNYIAECCAPGICENKDRVEINYGYNRNVRAFGIGGVIRTLQNFDKMDEFDTFIESRIQVVNITGTSRLSELVLDDINLSNYDSVSFDIAFNYGENLIVKFSGANSVELIDYISIPSIFTWHHVTIPLSDFGDLSLASLFQIEIVGTSILDQQILVDTIYFSMAGEPDYYCSAYYATWVDDLDPQESTLNLPDDIYKWPCDSIPGFGWTGTQCCGDDQGSFFQEEDVGEIEVVTNISGYFRRNRLFSIDWTPGHSTPMCSCDLDDTIHDCPLSFTTTENIGTCYDNTVFGGSLSVKYTYYWREDLQQVTENITLFDYIEYYQDEYEYYTDTLGGCWQGYTTLTDNTVGNVLNEEYFDDLLYANDSFHYCKFEPPQSICRVDTSCNAGEVEALYLSSLTNAHADTSSYSNKLCCDQNQFNNINLTNIYLSSDFNAHVDVTGDVGYGTNVSIGSSTGYAECRLSTKGVCDSGWSSLFSLSSETNAHIGEPYNYSLNYCCKVAGTISFDNYVKYDNPLVTEQGACAIPGTRAFCDNTNTWSTEKVQDLNNNEVDLKRNAIKTINSSSPRMREYASSGNTAGCCPDSYCWDGERCIDGTGSDTVSLDIVYDLEGSNNINDTGLVCSNGVWVKTEAKFTPHHDEFSYCSLNSQCYFNEGFNTRCYNGSGSGAFVDGYDFFCDNGDWSSRTKLLADTLFNIDKNGNTYSIFCDDTNLVLIQEITDVSNVPHAINEVGANKDEGWNWASVCVLAIDEDGNSQFGNPGDTVIIGVPLEDGWENLDSANFWNFADTCSDPAGILDNGNTYVQCTPNIWYNNFTNTIIFSEEDISNYMSPLLAGGSLLSKLIDWFTDFINLGKRVSNWLDFQELIHAREFTYKNILYNHIYYFEDGSNYIAGVKEFNLEKNNDAYYIIYTKYVGFTGLETCSNITIDGVPQFLTTSFTSSNYNKITCDTTSNVIIQEYKADEIDDVFWPDLTARLRPK